MKRNIEKLFISFILASVFLSSANLAFAHVVVKPSEVGAAAFQTFSVGVPVEKDNPTVSLRLVIPEGLKYVSPNVKPGWKIDIKKSGAGEDAAVTEITWTGGEIPPGQRDDFVFSAQAPAHQTSLIWKAYQTYNDGEVIAWDQKPSDKKDDKSVTPYSTTKVVNDLNTSGDMHHGSESKTEDSDKNLPTILSIAAIIMAGGSLFLQTRKKK
jgi:uncharacterized protein YcnI